MKKINKILVANRGEIAVRIFRAVVACTRGERDIQRSEATLREVGRALRELGALGP